MTKPIRRPHRRALDPNKMRLDALRRRAAEMFIAHAPLEDIATELGRGVETIKKWVRFEQERNEYALSLAAMIMRSRMNAVLDKITAKWLPMALSDDLNIEFQRGKQTLSLSHWEGAKAATDVVKNMLALQMKLNGLDTVVVDVKSNGMTLPEQIIKMVRDLAVKPIQAQIVDSKVIAEHEIPEGPADL